MDSKLIRGLFIIDETNEDFDLSVFNELPKQAFIGTKNIPFIALRVNEFEQLKYHVLNSKPLSFFRGAKNGND
jgi:hypothetical protein